MKPIRQQFPHRSLRLALLRVPWSRESDGSSLAKNEPVAVLVVRSRRARWVFIPCRERMHGRKRSDGKRVNDRFRSPANYDIGDSSPEVVHRVRNRLGAGGTRRNAGSAPPRVSKSIEIGGGSIRHEHGDRHWKHAPGTLFFEHVPRVEKSVEAANSGCKIDKNAFLGVGRRTRISPGFARGNNGKLR